VLRETKPTIYDLSLAGPSIRTFIGVSLFLIASGVQHDCHNYLASLKKYTLPQLPIFRALICPHFSAECVIYLALSIVAAPEGNLVNTTYLTILIFTAINLGITADFNREWYAKKFGEESIEGRWRMVPYFY
jgi:3-oxo-5-alpha-steroid 4-dehydrogenase 3 / polyprenol reductase